MIPRLSHNEIHSSKRDVISTRQCTSSHGECQHGHLHTDNVEVIPWPTFSPDLSTIDFYWMFYDHFSARSLLAKLGRHDDEDEVGLKEKPEDTRYIKKITSK